MTEEKVKDEAMQIIGMFQILPRLVVFDLDYTLWPFYCECRSKREMPSLYPQAKGILIALKEKGIEMAIASRSPTSDIANTFIDKLDIKSMFVAKEIFSSWTHKTEHFQKIHTRTTVPFTAMLFFDDEDRNIKSVNTYYFVLIELKRHKLNRRDCFFLLCALSLNLCCVYIQVSKMGVTSMLVGNGVTLGALRQGLTEFSQNHNTIEKNKQVWRNKYSGKAASSETDKD